ncbi:MAG TPA: ricin-type beta-trefoil lectin domain protein, partial [Polyangia bacterium]|nr:ricin-type beta-trefoil lectin domain protein [Polyangia bacterium]
MTIHRSLKVAGSTALTLSVVLGVGCSHPDFALAPDAGMGSDLGGQAGVGGGAAGGNGGGGGTSGGGATDLAIPPDLAIDRAGEIVDPSGMCVEVDAHADIGAGTAVQLGECSGAANQRWTFEPDGTIRALGYCLDVTSSGTTDGTLVQVWDCNGTDAQEWIQNPSKAIINPHAGKCLDATGASIASGTRLEIYDCNSGDNQNWTAAAHGVPNGRVVVYYQTQYSGNTYVSPLPLTTNATRVSDIAVAAFHLQSDLTVHLNNDPPSDATFTQMWKDLATMQSQGVRVEAMIGGAAKGSFAGLDTDFADYYPLLKNIIDTYHLDGVDLDVEETMSLAGIEKVILQLRS